MIKDIYILWYQGFDEAPDLVNKCVKSWEYYNPDWNIILLDETNYDKYTDIKFDLTKKQFSITHTSDVIRLLILNKHGGIWADATTFCNKPLNDWLPNYISQGFFAFDRPWPNLILNTWFLYAEKDSYIIKRWLKLALDYYNKYQTVGTYHISNYLFQGLYRDDKQFKRMYNNIPKISGVGARYLFECGFFNKINDEIKEHIKSGIVPVYKLTYKCEKADEKHVKIYDKTIILHYLYSTILKPYKNKRILK